MEMKKLAIFASGTGTNAVNIIKYFENSDKIETAFVLSNNTSAPVIEKAKSLGVTVEIVSNQEIEAGDRLIELCQLYKIDYIILAGFLRKIPTKLIEKYPQHIINIHPSLLPKYGGPGMYGEHVHKAVLANKEKESGITIHFVNADFDKGETIDQFKCSISEDETLASLQLKIHELERMNFPKVIEKKLTHDRVF